MKTLLTFALILISTVSFAKNKPVKTEYFESGKVKAVYFEKGNNMQFVYFYENGQIMEKGAFKNNLRSGTWKIYNTEGVKLAQADFKKGEKVGKSYNWGNDGELLAIMDN